jgi:cellobiose phosphorylase
MTATRPSATPPYLFQNSTGLRVEFNANGSIRRIDCGDITINAYLGSEMEGGLANLHVRRLGRAVESVALLGPRATGSVEVARQGLLVSGEWDGLRYAASFALAQSACAWLWRVAMENRSKAPVTVDAVYAQDLALAHYGAIRLNEYYVSQYVDHVPLEHGEHGYVLAARQNLSMAGRHPWLLVGSLGRAVGFATDALQFLGLDARSGKPTAALVARRLTKERLQHEHAMAVLQAAPVDLAPGQSIEMGFFAWFEADHPEPSGTGDLSLVERALAAFGPARSSARAAGAARGHAAPTTRATLFSARPTLEARELSDDRIERLFGTDRRHVERENGRMLSFFTGAGRHVVLAAKERAVLRPHGHILRTGNRLVPDEASLTSTVWMTGIFNSQLTQGHVNINRLLSTAHGYLGITRSCGQRIFVQLDDGYHLLDVPSAWEASPGACRWVYAHDGGSLEVRTVASVDGHVIELSVEVLDGPPRRFLISHHVALNGDDGAVAGPALVTRDGSGVILRAPAESDVGRRFPGGTFRVDPLAPGDVEQVGGDELLFADGRTRGQPYLVFVTRLVRSVGLRITGQLVESSSELTRSTECANPASDLSIPSATAASGDQQKRSDWYWARLLGDLRVKASGPGPAACAVTELEEIERWFAHNAMIHYLAPRGLEQYSGGAWGTRDVTQGPVEMLLALGRYGPVRDLLLRVFANQNPDGDWPQWFTFFERDRLIRPNDSHGDIVFWPLLALAEYLVDSEDGSILEQTLPYFDPSGPAAGERASLLDHVERALRVIERRVIPGTSLAAYGHGDWDDSLQPFDSSMRERLCSAWTVTLQYQTFMALAEALRGLGRAGEAERLESKAARVQEEFQRLLIRDDTIAGFAYFHSLERVDYWLHPRDPAGGIRFRLLPMVHAIINGMLTSEQVRRHTATIRQHLLGPDGARLFDRPVRYDGGRQQRFERAETSTFFGREMGVMYMHAHLRYAQAMAYCGETDAFFLALRQAQPIGIERVVPQARLRQSNCYASSSDGAVTDRYEGAARYGELLAGKVPFECGWRVYSSGAGIWVGLLRRCFLGLSLRRSSLVIDPVIPKALDGLSCQLDLQGSRVEVVYRIARLGHGPRRVLAGGRELAVERRPNPYRTGSVTIAMDALREAFQAGPATIVVHLE